MSSFIHRHIGPSQQDIQKMVQAIGVASVDELLAQTVPPSIRMQGDLQIGDAITEPESLAQLDAMAKENQVWRSFLGLGYHRTHTPTVILRNIVENPSWYTSYTPYQAEISQGRLEALLVFQTMIQDVTGMAMSNSSLLDESTAAAEAMAMLLRSKSPKKKNKESAESVFFISELCHPHTINVVKVRAEPLGVKVVVGDHNTADFTSYFGVLLQYPATNGSVIDYRSTIDAIHQAGGQVVVAADLLALTLLTPPGEFGADIVVGNSQRFGVPLGFGGPHAAFLACSMEHSRNMPGRIIGVSEDASGNKALRMALQSREQHIRREKATSNVCTAQALLANVAAMYAVYHGPTGLTEIAKRVHAHAKNLAHSLKGAGYTVSSAFFDTVTISCGDQDKAMALCTKASEYSINLRRSGSDIIIALDECVTTEDVQDLCAIFGASVQQAVGSNIPAELLRTSEFLRNPVFNSYHSETDMLRYLHKLAKKDLALDTAMIPLGSCTMKLNATTEMIPITWSGFNAIHPYAPVEQTKGYQRLFADLETWLAEVTGFDAISLQPNAGSQGEYAGLLAIRGYHKGRGEGNRDICLIPTSAHGTNPASAVMAGMQVVKVDCDDQGNIDVEDLKKRAEQAGERLSALMITYPSTHGVFEESVKNICQIIHAHGGQVYMDGANMNAMVGIARPGDIGADVCHLNLHKTFCIPHGGGGPGVGPIGVKAHLQPYLPGNPLEDAGAVSGANYGSASILPISWAYIAMMGGKGLRTASEIAILSANYLASRLEPYFPVLYRGANGRCAHECILDLRPFKKYGVEVADVSKRLMDYGFHSPTMSWPVTGTLMVEPTESEPLRELDRFVEAMIMIRGEIQKVIDGEWTAEQSPLHNAPHNHLCVAEEWNYVYSRETAVFPTQATKENKYWPTVRRINDAHGDRNLFCSCSAWIEEDARC